MAAASAVPAAPLSRQNRVGVVVTAVLVIIALVLATPLVANAQAPSEITPEERASAITRPAMVYIETDWSAYVQDHEGDWLNGGEPYQWTSRCSGFVVNPSGYIATAGHCVDDGLDYGARFDAVSMGVDEWIANGWATEAERETLLEIGYATWQVEGEGADSPPDRQVYVAHGKATSGLATGESLPARVVDVKPVNDGDVALLRVEATDMPMVELADDAAVSIGEPVLSIGYPASSDAVTDATLEPTYKDGKISSKNTREGGLLPVYEISAAVSQGMSGGPTVNHDGMVVGVNSFSSAGESQQFNFLSPASLVSEMLSRNGVSNKLGPVDVRYRDGLELYFAGEYRAAMEAFDQVLARVPSHQQAQEFRTKAAPLAEAEGPAIPLWATLSAGVVLVLLLAGGTLLIIRSKRSKRGPEAPADADVDDHAPQSQPEPAGTAEPQLAPTAVIAAPVSASNGQPMQPAAESLSSAEASIPRAEQAAVPVQAPVVAASPLGFAPPVEMAGEGVAAPFCSGCGTPSAIGARFCSGCGRTLMPTA